MTQPEANQWADAPQAALNARAELAQHLNIDIDAIGLVSAEKVDWPDSCLGIQRPEMSCLAAVTPGYKVILTAGGQQYEYHTDVTGEQILLATP